MNRIGLLNTMNGIVNNYVEYYKNDFMYDIDFLYNTTDAKIIWIVRKCGTNIVRLWPADNDNETIKNAKLTLECYKEIDEKTTVKNRYYIIDIKNNELKEITSSHAIARCYTKK